MTDEYRQWHELTTQQQDQARQQFRGTGFFGHVFAQFEYVIGKDGDVLMRRWKSRQEAQHEMGR